MQPTPPNLNILFCKLHHISLNRVEWLFLQVKKKKETVKYCQFHMANLTAQPASKAAGETRDERGAFSKVLDLYLYYYFKKVSTDPPGTVS